MTVRKHLLTAVLTATLPVMAGFVVSAPVYAQGLQYEAQGSGDYTRTAQLEQQVRELTDQLEQRDFQIRQLQSAFDKFAADTNMRLQALEQKLSGTITGSEPPAQQGFETPAAPDAGATPAASNPPAPSPVNNAAPATDPNAPYSGAATENRPDRNLGQIVESVKGGETVTAGKPQAVNAAQAYDKAFSFLQENNYTDAQRAFAEFLKNYPSHPLAANAQYWLGETYFAQTQYTSAAKVFAKAFQEHPQGQKAPDALLKLALTLEKMNKKDDACLTLGELAKRFPTGPASVLKRASEEGARMGCKS